MTSVNEEYPSHIVSLIDLAFRQIKSELEEVRGVLAPELRPFHVRLLAQTPSSGMRVTDLAVRAGMTKQALGEFVGDLQRTGHLEVVGDPADRRVRIVRPTPAGAALRVAVDAAINELEQRWREEVGERPWETFREVLAQVGARQRPAEPARRDARAG